ncbi:MAG: hypothetical protein APF76_12715 [Desulfitibacter sp. BRH_c19]|nr:MAG: hypothetical protein APF76_12715 [Desulfitibacter sp. BRH_c19]
MIWMLIAIIIVIVDQATKLLIVNSIDYGNKITLINKLFYLTNVENTGAAWSILENGRYFFILMAMLVSSLIIYLIFKLNGNLIKTALTFFLGGAVGNLIDRVTKGAVTDFFGILIGSYQFPVFNVADVFIVCGTAILCYYILFANVKQEFS